MSKQVEGEGKFSTTPTNVLKKEYEKTLLLMEWQCPKRITKEDAHGMRCELKRRGIGRRGMRWIGRQASEVWERTLTKVVEALNEGVITVGDLGGMLEGRK